MKKNKKKTDYPAWADPVDSKPMVIDSGLEQPEDLDTRIRRIIKTQISPMAALQGEESLEESEDFNVDDEFDVDNPITPYEESLMVPEIPAGSPVLPESDLPGPEEPREVHPKEMDEEEFFDLCIKYKQAKGVWPEKLMERRWKSHGKEVDRDGDITNPQLHGKTGEGEQEQS